MKNNIPKLITVCVTIASCILASCDTCTNHNPMHVTYADINIISSDGNGHRVILGERSYYANLLPTKYGILYANNNFSLYSMNYDGSNQSRLFSNIPWGDRYFSPDESKLILASDWLENNQYQNNLFLMNPDGSDLVPLSPQKGQYLYPHISPHLDEIVFIRDGGVATINIDGTNLQTIRVKTDSTRCMYTLYVDQDRILYFEQASATASIRLFDKLTRRDKVIGTSAGGFPGYGRILVNGNLLFSDALMIKVLDIDAATISTLVQGYYPSYSSDGSRIVYVKGSSMYMMDAHGGNQQTMYTEQASTKSIGFPLFSADDKNIIFTTSYTEVAP